MASDEILRRIEDHIAQGSEHMARSNELMARGNELMAEVRHEVELTRQAVERSNEIHERSEDIHERNRVAFEGVMDAIADVRAEFQKNRETHTDLRGFIREMVRRNEVALTQLIEESRANTREILSRLPPAPA